MKLKTTETPIMSGGDLKMKGFQIAASAKAFRILSSNLYKNKIRAIIRELSCNAVDGHIANGNKGTFDVQLPGMLDPQFRIRDYGCGMDDDTIMNLYTTYFASTKSDSNDYIGALGLGSKSPFSYTDSFTVVSFFNGVRRMYSAFIKDGEPTITKVSESETDEPNGIEITVPVNPQDAGKWKEEARYVFTSFGEIRPKVIGNLPIDFLPHDKNEFEVKNSVHGAGVFAIMGNIVYPLPADMWNNTMIKLSMTAQNSWSSRGQTAFYIRFDLGELDITPSREELSLDDETLKNIKDRIYKTDIKMSQDIIKIVSESDDVRALRNLINSKYNAHYWNHVLASPQYKMKNGNSVAKEQDLRTNFVAPTYKVTDDKGNVDKKNVPIYRYDLTLMRPRGKHLDNWQLSNIAGYGKDTATLFIDDKKSGAIRTMQGLKMLNKIKGASSSVYLVNVAYAAEALAEFQKCWPGDQLAVFYSSKCDDARKANPTAKKAVAKKAPNTVMVHKDKTVPVALYAEDIKNLKGFWIPMYQNEYVSTELKFTAMCSIETVRIFMKHRGLKEIPVIKSSHWTQVEKNKDMKMVWEEMLQLVLDLKDKLTIDIFPYDNRGNSMIQILRRSKELEFIADAVSKQNKATDLHALFRDVLRNLNRYTSFDVYKKNEKTLKEMLKTFEDLTILSENEGKKEFDKFLKNNSLIAFYLQRCYGSFEQRYIDDIKRTVQM